MKHHIPPPTLMKKMQDKEAQSLFRELTAVGKAMIDIECNESLSSDTYKIVEPILEGRRAEIEKRLEAYPMTEDELEESRLRQHPDQPLTI